MKIPWFLFSLSIAALAFSVRQFVVAVVVWKTYRRSAIPSAPLLAPDLKPEERS